MTNSDDCILTVGVRDRKLVNLLERLGFHVLEGRESLQNAIGTQVVDAIVLDAGGEAQALDLCEHFRQEEHTKKIPLVVLCDTTEQVVDFQSRRFPRTEVVKLPLSVGTLTSKIATQLRLRKLDGVESVTASLGEMNAALRDFKSRIKKEIDEARTIQQNLLPAKLPAIEGCECAVIYQPLEDVGGDWYTVQETPSRKILIQVADVTGHGLAAAFICSMTKLALTASSEEQPGRLLERMNGLLAPQLPDGRFVTCVSALYDASNGELRVATAGHPPLLIVRAGGAVDTIGARGFALGFFPESDYVTEEATLEPGDALICFSDGISEAQNRSLKTYGIERVGSAAGEVQKSGSASAQALLDAVVRDFEAFRDGRLLKDDVTAVVLRRSK